MPSSPQADGDSFVELLRACTRLEELEIVDRIVDIVDENTYERVCQYMIRWVIFHTA